MSTAPWSETAPAALRESVFHVATATLVPATGDPITLDVETGTVTFDEAWSPHVQADTRCTVPDVQAVLDAIDPRAGARVRIDAGYIYPGGRRDVHTLSDLCLRSRPVTRPRNTMTLTAASDEVRAQDMSPLGATRNLGATVTVVAAIADLIGWALPGSTIQVTATSTVQLGVALTVTTGADVWAVVADLADRVDAWVYVAGDRVWQVADRPGYASVSAYVAETGPVGNLEDTEAALDVADWGNAVLVTYPEDILAWAVATSGPFATTPRKVIKVRRDTTPGDATARQRVAEALLRRALSRGRGLTLTGPAAYWLRPGHTITAQLPTGPQERHLVARVAFDLGAGSMTVRTRVPDDDTTITTGA